MLQAEICMRLWGEVQPFSHSYEALKQSLTWDRLQDGQLSLDGWLEAHRQHDVCEFFSHLTIYMQPLLFQGEWQARRLAAAMGNAACCIDRGFGTQAIPLPIPSGVCGPTLGTGSTSFALHTTKWPNYQKPHRGSH